MGIGEIHFNYDYNEKILEHLHNVELIILNDFIKICEENNLQYHLHAGTLLGAVRHEGFIPWDDEIDIGMFREDYEKFLKIMETEYQDKYYLINWKTEYNITEEIYTPKSFMCLKNTKLIRDTNIGIFIDISVIDNKPQNSIEHFIFLKEIKLINTLFFIFPAFKNNTYSTSFRRMIGNTIKHLFKLFHITPNLMSKFFTKIILKYEKKTRYVCDISYFYSNTLDISLFKEYKKVKFENLYAYIPKQYDDILKSYYGNYMQIPKESERENHVFDNIDFGEY